MAARSPVSYSSSHSNTAIRSASAEVLAAPTRPAWAAALKRVIDIFGSSIGIVLLSPVFFTVAILIKAHDGGPVLHRRRVLGPKGFFDAFKFRSMRPDADAILNADPVLHRRFQKQFKLANDPRVTPLGLRLRKYSLDELPQLFNVLSGQMSLVGPRMITAPEVEKYGEYWSPLLSVRPGLTGYWQVNGRQTVGYKQRVEMDMYYIRNWSLLLDLRILLQTPSKVIKAEGAV